MKDAFGNPIQLHDRVAYNPPSYKGLVVGRVTGFTPKSVRVLRATRRDNGETTTRFPGDVVVDVRARVE